MSANPLVPRSLAPHPSVLFPLPIGNYAHVLVRDNLNAPRYVPGDVLLVNLDINRFVADGLYVVDHAGRQLVRYLQDVGNGLRMFTGSAPHTAFVVTPETCRVLGMVEAAAQVRRVG